MKVVFLNGPARSGKDTAGRIIKAELESSMRLEIVKFAAELKKRVHAAYNCRAFGEILPHDAYEETKDQISADFLGITPQAAYIGFSERYMKPIHGQDIFGRLLLDHMERTLKIKHILRIGDTRDIGGFLITDSGFREEAEPIVKHFGAENCLLVKLSRDGFDFRKDSRGYIDLSDLGVTTFLVNNTGVINELTAALGPIIHRIEI